AMRARGAKATDIVVLVVAADDGVMPQTKEAIEHARAAEVPLVVAVNKIDKENADPERVRNELAALEVIPEEWGGENIFVQVSAITGENIDALLEAILLQSEILELKAVESGNAKGVVIEASLDKGRGPVATVLVQSGQLQQGQMLLAGTQFGRVRAIYDESAKSIKSAGPSMPVQVLGLSGVPNAGDDVFVVENEKKAREFAEIREIKIRETKVADQQKIKMQSMFDAMTEGQVAEVNVLVKADVQGSSEAIRHALEKLSTDEVRAKLVATGVGGINESDINLAAASSAMVIGFNVRADAAAKRTAGDYGIDIRYYSVIYDIIDDVKSVMSGMLAPESRENILGLAEVKDVFRSPKFGDVAGSIVVEGVVRKGLPIRVLRENVVIYEGELESLRRFKEPVEEVRMGTECGIAVKNYTDVRPGDRIEVFERIEVARTLE
ncbi:MAG: translation initiation factor IF-2, partial [Proteobacteria bacterium]|nr:translation initiation factor IF-2 [Pseudomonadota bacterium]